MKTKVTLSILILIIISLAWFSFLKLNPHLNWRNAASLGLLENPKELKILIGGDLMFDRNIRLNAKRKGGYDWFFASTTSLFASMDLVVANLEGPITSNPSKTLLSGDVLTKSFQFTFDPKVAQTLSKVGFSLVSLANNHSSNFGQEGLVETKKYLAEAGVDYFGSPYNESGTEKIITRNGIRVAFVGYHAFQPGFDNVILTIKDIATSKKADFIVVMPHWGEEYLVSPSQNQKDQAKAMIAAGANAIIGSHSHVIGLDEQLGNVPIYYSLGNFLFDQYFSDEVMRGKLIELDLSKADNTTKIKNIKTYFVSNKPRSAIDIVEAK